MSVHSKRSHEGYLLIDHRASPGLPEGFFRDQGINAPAVAGGSVGEFPTLTCKHCGTVVIVNPNRTRERPYCRGCDHYICDNCATVAASADYVHAPLQKRVDEIQERAFRAESTGIPMALATEN